MSTIYKHLLSKTIKGEKLFALLIDPDEYSASSLKQIIKLASDNNVDYIFVGGSLMVENRTGITVETIKKLCKLPVILFPGSTLQFTDNADAILFLSLLSGRNPELLIGKHIEVAPGIKKSGVEAIPTAYLLIDGGKPTTASYISNSQPIPNDKHDIALSTAVAGELLGMKLIFMDAGSGAKQKISAEMIQKVKAGIDIPLIIGGGIRDTESMKAAYRAGADLVVIGNVFESDAERIVDFANTVKQYNKE